MSTVLETIIEGVRQDLDTRRATEPLRAVRARALETPAALDARQALTGGRDDPQGVRIIAEVKRSSPSKGPLSGIPDPGALARAYQDGGASVVSVLTEQRRFNGTLDDLQAVREAVDLPVLRKDFMVDEYQFHEARAYGADLVLLIVAALDDVQLQDFLALTHHLGMNALVEAHTEEEIERAVAAEAAIVGVNVRNLKTLDIDTTHYAEMAQHLPDGVIRVAESGVDGPHMVRRYAQQGADAVLVGEALVRNGNPRSAVSSFRAASVAKEDA